VRVSRRQVVQGAGIAGLGLLVGCGQWPGQAAPTPKVHRIGLLTPGPALADPALRDAFQQGLRELGYVEGQHYVSEYRHADGQAARLPGLAAELVELGVDVIRTSGTLTTEAARDATSTIPIVMIYPADPVASGLVDSLARPGGNITGLTEIQGQLGPKRLELLKEAMPGLARVALIRDPEGAAPQSPASLQDAAQTLGIQLQVLDARYPADLDAAFEVASRAGAEAIFWGGGRAYRSPEYRSRALTLAAQHRLPVVSGFPEWVEAGGLLAYATNYPAMFRRTAAYVDKILKGTKPAELPIEQPMRFDFVINLRTAQALGLTIPHHVLLQATEVIQ
jgi:putative tryptophan/tyrosine transport system substrate-binding protein